MLKKAHFQYWQDTMNRVKRKVKLNIFHLKWDAYKLALGMPF